MAGKRKQRAPVVTVSSDDFIVMLGEQEFKPHEGEEVVFKKRLSPGDLLTLVKAEEMRQKDDVSGQDMIKFYHDEACPVIAKALVSWTWTDPWTDKKLPEPDLAVVRDLDISTEVMYLLGKWLEVCSPDTVQEKNPQPPSP